MSGSGNYSTTKIEINLNNKQKEILERAAEERGMNIGDFLIEAALELATKMAGEPENIVLSPRDWEIFAAAIANPPEPNETLKAAIREYDREYGN